MIQTLMQSLMKTYAQKQERFIHLFVYISPTMRACLFDDSVLKKRVADACTAYIQTQIPGELTHDIYHQLNDEDQIRRLTDKLIADHDISDRVLLNTARQVRKHAIVEQPSDIVAKIAAMTDDEYKEHVKYQIGSSIRTTCSEIASHVWEAYRHLMQRTLTRKSDNTQEPARLL